MSERLTGRNGQIWLAFIAGETQEALAARFDISQQRVSQIIADCRAAVPASTREELVQEAAELLRRLRRGAMELVEAGPIPAYSNGRPIVLDDGSTAEDHTARLAAMRMVLSVEERAAKLLGLDAATRMEHTVSGAEQAAAQSAALDAAARLARAREEES